MAQKRPQTRKTTVKPKPTVRTKPAAAKKAQVAVPEPLTEPAEASQTRGQKLGRKLGHWLTISSIPEVLLVATFAMARYLKNSDFSYPSEIILDIVLLGVVVSAAFYVFKLVLRRNLPAHVAGLLFAYALYSFTTAFPRLHHYADKLIPGNPTPFADAMLKTLFLAVVFGLIGYGIDKLSRSLKVLRTAPILKFLLFVVCFVFVTELGKTGLRIWNIRHDLLYKAPTISLQKAKTVPTASKPDVYYLLFDRYASASTLKNIYNYDNSPLLNYLSDQGFVTRNDAYSNYSFTMMSVSSTLSMGYHTKIGAQFKDDSKNFQTAFPYRQLLDNPAVAKTLQSNGYKYNQVSSWWDFTRKIPTADSEPTESFRLRIFGKTFWLSDLQRDIVNKSILSPLLIKGATVGHTAIVKYDLDHNPVENFNNQIAAVKAIAQGSAKEQTPQFTFAHILSPHDPYIFDNTGGNPTYGHERDDEGADETLKYTNQVTYLNTRIKELVGSIRSKDPSAVIVLQADEGPYPKQFRGTLSSTHYYDPVNLPLPQMQQKLGILASYYMPGVDKQTVSSQIDSSVNAFRFVLNQYEGYDLKMLPDCQYSSGDKFSLYNYQLITGMLKGTADSAACKAYK